MIASRWGARGGRCRRRLLAVGPPDAISDELAVVADEQVANDLSDRAELAVGRLEQSGADVVAEPDAAARRVGVPRPRLCPALLVLGGRVAEALGDDVGTLARTRRTSRSSSCSDSCSRSVAGVGDGADVAVSYGPAA